MSETEKPPRPDDPGGGVTPLTEKPVDPPTYASATENKGLQGATTAATAAGGVTGGRSWRQIVEDAKKQNILQITINKISKIENGETVKPRNLKHDDIATFLFDILSIIGSF